MLRGSNNVAFHLGTLLAGGTTSNSHIAARNTHAHTHTYHTHTVHTCAHTHLQIHMPARGEK